MRALTFLAAVSAALALVPAQAQDAGERFRMTPTPDGFLKLDSRTGAVSECKRIADAYQCRLVPDEQRALQAEIDRLLEENAALKEQLAKGAPRTDQGTRQARPALPTDEEIDRALGIMEKFLRRFMGILREERTKAI